MMNDTPSFEGVSQQKTLKPQEFFVCPKEQVRRKMPQPDAS